MEALQIMGPDIIPGTVDRGVPSPPPGASRGAMVRRPRADMRCEVWVEARTESEAVILSWTEAEGLTCVM